RRRAGGNDRRVGAGRTLRQCSPRYSAPADRRMVTTIRRPSREPPASTACGCRHSASVARGTAPRLDSAIGSGSSAAERKAPRAPIPTTKPLGLHSSERLAGAGYVLLPLLLSSGGRVTSGRSATERGRRLRASSA